MEIEFSLADIDRVARQIHRELKHPVTVFNGEMGAGKTTLIKALCKSLGIADAISSPTFSLVNEYRDPGGRAVYHFDMYRLKAETEALDMGIEEYLHSGSLCFIEWAEKIPNLLPREYHTVSIGQLPDGLRKVTFG